MSQITRRALLGSGGSAAALSLCPHAALAQPQPSLEKWMDGWMSLPRSAGGTLHLTRFREPIYVLLRPIYWKPNPGQATSHKRVDVPKGFVTDFASVPQVFWWRLRPDGEYTYPAIIHDYLYWTQTVTREAADEIFKFAMQDFKIDTTTTMLVYQAVRLGGKSAWAENAKLKAKGEKRVLRKVPDDPTQRWIDWKTRADVFA